MRLRKTPRVLTADSIATLFGGGFFNHASDLSGFGLAPRVRGSIRHSYKNLRVGGAEVVVDFQFGLMWQQDSGAEKIAPSAIGSLLGEANDNSHLGFEGWRIPTIEELGSLVEFEKNGKGLFIDPVFRLPHISCWSGDSARKSGLAEPIRWGVHFDNGTVTRGYGDHTGFLWLTRDLGDADLAPDTTEPTR